MSIEGYPRSLRFPEATVRRVRNRRGDVIEEIVGYCTAQSTAPKEPGMLDVLRQSWWKLSETEHVAIWLALLLGNEPWMKGEKWEKAIRGHRFRPSYEIVLSRAWKAMTQDYARRVRAEERTSLAGKK